jgi:hypothetical protein
VTTPQEIQEARATMRSAYTLLRAECSYEYGHLIDSLEQSHEALIESAFQTLDVLATTDNGLRQQVLTRAAAIMRDTPKVPLQLVKDVYEGESVA